MQVPKNRNNMLNTRTPNTSQSVTFNHALRREHHTIKFARPKEVSLGPSDVCKEDCVQMLLDKDQLDQDSLE